MARLPRLVIPSQPHHLIQRGHNGQPVFVDAADYQAFLGWLRGACRGFKVALHAYVLMPEQLQLLASPADATGLGQMMQWIGRYYVPYFNQKHGRSGSLWQGRYKTSVIDAGSYLLSCSRYIEQAPVGHGLAGAARDYPWSSYAHHVGTRADPLITDHPLYWALGNTPFEREAAYLALAGEALGADQVRALEQALLKGQPLGSDQFKLALERQVKRPVMPAKRGRPFKSLPHSVPD
jgi:putative transposase